MRTEERKKKFGEVFTPMSLVAKMLQQLPREIWSDPTKTFCDPTCGNGNFLVGVVKLKIIGGSTPLQALSTTYGVDIMDDNIAECRERLLSTAEKTSGESRTPEWVSVVEHNIICGDSLSEETWKRFDE